MMIASQNVNLGIAIGLQLMQAALDWQQKLASGGITEADVDAKLAELKMGSRQQLVDAIAAGEANAPAVAEAPKKS